MTSFRARIREIAEEAADRFSNGHSLDIESAILRAIEELLAREPSEGMRAAGWGTTRECEMCIKSVATPETCYRAMTAQLWKEIKE